MINKDILIKYVRIISGCDADPNYTLVDFSLNDEQRNIVNTVNNEAKKDKKLAALLEDLKYSNNKNKDIEKYFNINKENKSVKESKVTTKKEVLNRTIGIKESYGFVNVASLTTTVVVVVWILLMIITFGAK